MIPDERRCAEGDRPQGKVQCVTLQEATFKFGRLSLSICQLSCSWIAPNYTRSAEDEKFRRARCRHYSCAGLACRKSRSLSAPSTRLHVVLASQEIRCNCNGPCDALSVIQVEGTELLVFYWHLRNPKNNAANVEQTNTKTQSG